MNRFVSSTLGFVQGPTRRTLWAETGKLYGQVKGAYGPVVSHQMWRRTFFSSNVSNEGADLSVEEEKMKIKKYSEVGDKTKEEQWRENFRFNREELVLKGLRNSATEEDIRNLFPGLESKNISIRKFYIAQKLDHQPFRGQLAVVSFEDVNDKKEAYDILEQNKKNTMILDKDGRVALEEFVRGGEFKLLTETKLKNMRARMVQLTNFPVPNDDREALVEKLQKFCAPHFFKRFYFLKSNAGQKSVVLLFSHSNHASDVLKKDETLFEEKKVGVLPRSLKGESGFGFGLYTHMRKSARQSDTYSQFLERLM
eukprot:Nk52_evm40s554 gene=Nk52_evmTU40s554